MQLTFLWKRFLSVINFRIQKARQEFNKYIIIAIRANAQVTFLKFIR